MIFLTEENDIYIAKPGDLIRGRYRLVRFGFDFVVIQDLLTGHLHHVQILV